MDKEYYLNIDVKTLKKLINILQEDRAKLLKDMDYYIERYRPNVVEEMLVPIRPKVFSLNSLIAVLEDLEKQILKEKKEWQALNLLNPNSKYGDYASPIPSAKKERS